MTCDLIKRMITIYADKNNSAALIDISTIELGINILSIDGYTQYVRLLCGRGYRVRNGMHRERTKRYQR